MLCVVILEVEDGDLSDLKSSALNVHSSVVNVQLLKFPVIFFFISLPEGFFPAVSLLYAVVVCS